MARSVLLRFGLAEVTGTIEKSFSEASLTVGISSMGAPGDTSGAGLSYRGALRGPVRVQVRHGQRLRRGPLAVMRRPDLGLSVSFSFNVLRRSLDAVMWPFVLVLLLNQAALAQGLLRPALAVATLSAAFRLCSAVLLNHRYRFTTWWCARVMAVLLLVWAVMKLSLPA